MGRRTAFATSPAGDDNAIGQAITVFPNIGSTAAAESIVNSLTVHAAAGTTVKPARTYERLSADVDRQHLSGSNRNNRENATPATTFATCGTDNHDCDLCYTVRDFERLLCIRTKKRVTVRRSAAFNTCARYTDRRLRSGATCKQCDSGSEA